MLKLLATVALAATASITQIRFVTPIQTVAPNVTSDKITIQTQNSTGVAEQVSQKLDLILTSSSPTGQFLTSSGKPIVPSYDYMSSGSANRTFYYRDAIPGNYFLTISAKNEPWQASQMITIDTKPKPPMIPKVVPVVVKPETKKLVTPTQPETKPIQTETKTIELVRPSSWWERSLAWLRSVLGLGA